MSGVWLDMGQRGREQRLTRAYNRAAERDGIRMESHLAAAG